jgi:hypothetical protein
MVHSGAGLAAQNRNVTGNDGPKTQLQTVADRESTDRPLQTRRLWNDEQVTERLQHWKPSATSTAIYGKIVGVTPRERIARWCVSACRVMHVKGWT